MRHKIDTQGKYTVRCGSYSPIDIKYEKHKYLLKTVVATFLVSGEEIIRLYYTTGRVTYNRPHPWDILRVEDGKAKEYYDL